MAINVSGIVTVIGTEETNGRLKRMLNVGAFQLRPEHQA